MNLFERLPVQLLNRSACDKGAPGIKFVVSYGYSDAYATEVVLLPLKAGVSDRSALGTSACARMSK
jgi:hypothetical protein